MVTEIELKGNYLRQHTDLEILYYDFGAMDKETFDSQHGQLWNNLDADMIAAGFKEPPVPPRDLAKEIDELKAKVDLLRIPK